MVVSVAGTEVGAPARRAGFYRELVSRVARIPSVEAVGAINHLPLAGDLWNASYYAEGHPIPAEGDRPSAVYRVVMPGYFETMRLPLVAGRGIADGDDEGKPRVVVVNDELARRQWPGESAIGKRLTLGDPRQPEWLTVVGVARDAARESWTAPPSPEVYVPLLQSQPHLESASSAFAYLTLVVRTGGGEKLIGAAVRRIVASLDRDVPVSEVASMERVVGDATAGARFYLMVLSMFAGLALTLAAAGIYSIMHYRVTSRRREIAIRRTLGATRAAILRLVLRRSLGVAAGGALIGMTVAAGLTRFMTTILFGVSPTDPVTFIAVPLILIGVAALAASVPAVRAAQGV
jgi:putative ABC transport system permease protein